MPFSDDDFNRQLSWFCETTAQVLQDSRPDGYAPTLFVLSDSLDSALKVVQGVPETPEKRIQWMRELGQALFREQRWVPAAAFLAAEAWRSEVLRGGPLVLPSRDPARQEIVLVLGATRDGRQNEAEILLRRSPLRKRLLPSKRTFHLYKPGGENIRNGLLTAFFEGCESALEADGPADAKGS